MRELCHDDNVAGRLEVVEKEDDALVVELAQDGDLLTEGSELRLALSGLADELEGDELAGELGSGMGWDGMGRAMWGGSEDATDSLSTSSAVAVPPPASGRAQGSPPCPPGARVGVAVAVWVWGKVPARPL